MKNIIFCNVDTQQDFMDKDWMVEVIENWYDNPEKISQGHLVYHQRDYNTLTHALRTEFYNRVDGLKKKPEYDYTDDGRKVEIIENIIHNQALSKVKEVI